MQSEMQRRCKPGQAGDALPETALKKAFEVQEGGK